VTAALGLSGICKAFGAFPALDHAEFAAHRGEVHALLGENGAGKSSLMNVAAGLYVPDAGRMELDGVALRLSGPRDASAHRIGMVHQHFKLVKPFTVVENILLANPRRHFRSGLGEIEREVRRQADDLGFAIDPHRRIDTLSVAEQQRVEILKVLIAGAEILILDEPTAVLTDEEADRLLMTARGIALRGAAVVLVTHKLSEVHRFADRVTVMRGGRTIASVDPKTVSTTDLTRLTVGDAVTAPLRSERVAGNSMLYVASLRCARADGHVMVDGVTFSVRAGEIYGMAGVSGNGQTEIAEALMGLRAPVAGSIEIAGAGDVTRRSPDTRRHLGIAAIPADRYAYGLASSLSIMDNFAIGEVHTGRYGSWVRVDKRAMRKGTQVAVAAFDVQGVRSLRQKAALLSGGNAQKLVLARELGRKPTVIIAHSPSRGLDVRACAAVQARLLAAREAGAAVVLISDDLDEILSLSDRIGVMVRGRIVAEFRAPADRQAVGGAMVHHA
jgi:ABC-type uncharacterized transport system ATPase subunit